MRERDWDAAITGKALDARVVPRDGKGGDGACRRAARSVSPCPWGDHEEAPATHPQGSQSPMALLVIHGAPSAGEGASVGKRVEASMAIAIELSDHQAQALSEAATRLQDPEAELAAAAVRDLLAHQSADFDVAAQRVLEKNHELYQRLT